MYAKHLHKQLMSHRHNTMVVTSQLTVKRGTCLPLDTQTLCNDDTRLTDSTDF
jgi:hypothetical protein